MRKLRLWRRGATQLRFMDVLTALILLAILVWVAWMQFPAYHAPTVSPAPAPRNTVSP